MSPKGSSFTVIARLSWLDARIRVPLSVLGFQDAEAAVLSARLLAYRPIFGRLETIV
jgi:hypothetical protein